MAESAVTSRGQITIPVEIRRALGLKPGHRVVFTLLPDGSTMMRAKTRKLTELSGMLKGLSTRTVAVEDMRIGRQ